MTKIVLDSEAFKALASDTRLQILKALDARPLTVSELSRLLLLNKATVFEHLKQLMGADLAKREDDPARKWVYYRLTWKGRNVLHPENAQIFLMLGLAALGLGGGVLQAVYVAQQWFGRGGFSSASSPLLGDQESADSDKSGGTDAPASSPEPAAAGAPPSTTTPPPAAPVFGEEGGGGGGAWWEPFASAEFFVFLGILGFLTLLALIAWTLYGRQRTERAQIRKQIGQFPPDVNKAEEKVG